MNYLPLIIKREYLTKVKNKSFIIMTFVSPLIMVFLALVVGYLTKINSEKTREIVVLDNSGLLGSVFTDNETTKYTLLNNMTLSEAKEKAQAIQAYGLLFIDKQNSIEDISKQIEFFSSDTPSISFISNLESVLDKKLTQINLQKNGVDLNLINASKINVAINQENFKGNKTSKIDSVLKLIFGGATGYLLFMFIIIYGNMIMRSVIEEKTNRIIEVIISSVKPIYLMLGKIIGTSLAGITQFVIWLIVGGILISIASLLFGVNIFQSPQQDMLNNAIAQNQNVNLEVQQFVAALNHLPITNLIIAFILFFVCGFLLYSSLYAAIGAAVDNETDTQQFMFPIIMPLVLAVYIGFFTVIEDPHGTISTVFSFIPFTSPVVMLMRIPFGVPIWQQILALIILIGTFIVVVWIASKIYRVGILMYGKKPSYKEILKWIKY